VTTLNPIRQASTCFDAGPKLPNSGAMGGDRRLTHGFFHSSAPLLQALPHGLPILTAFAESAVNEVMAKRMNKKQQMRWNRYTVQPFLMVRVHVLRPCIGASGPPKCSAVPTRAYHNSLCSPGFTCKIRDFLETVFAFQAGARGERPRPAPRFNYK
jgi:hypothetical protein